MKFISIPIFILSFAVGLFFVYISSSSNKTIVVYPTPENQNKVQFVDKAETCHRYMSSEVTCPTNSDKVIEYDVQS